MKIIIVIAILLLVGCATAGRKIDPAAVDKITKGTTTRAQVLALIGSPDQMTKNSNGETTFMYQYVRATAKGANFVPVVGLFAGGVNMENQMVMVTFGPDGIVKDVMSTQGASDVGTGLNAGSRQPLPEVEDGKRAK